MITKRGVPLLGGVESIGANGGTSARRDSDPDRTAELKLMPEYGVEWGIWAGWLPYYDTPRLRSKSGLARFSSPRSLGLTADLEERLPAE